MIRRVLLTVIAASCMAAALALTGSIGHASGVRIVDVKDQCDPASFNARIGPGTCVGHPAGVPFDTFIQELTNTQQAGAWHFAPGVVHLMEGQAIQARNVGGEAHTFTEVAQFGGGFVQLLNDLSGNPVPAPECLQPNPGFIAPGTATTPEVEASGVHRYQCCIHPWMRTVLMVR